MRFVSYETNGTSRVGALQGDDQVVDLQAAYAAHLVEEQREPRAADLAAVRIPADMVRFIAGLEPSWEAATAAFEFAAGRPAEFSVALSDVTLKAPLIPPVILNSGQNYWDHREEKPEVDQKEPEFFVKAPMAVIGPNEPVIYDHVVTSKLDYEVELAVIIGKPGRHIPKERALEHVFGYTIANDISARDRQAVPHPQGGFEYALGPGKNFDTSAPLGPVIVTRDEIPDPQNLALRTFVNDELRQNNTTGKMIWSVSEIIAFFSHFYTLPPGLVIETGTPGGTAWASDPLIGGKPYERDDITRGRYLQPGDVVRVEIDPIGSLSNRIVEAREPV